MPVIECHVDLACPFAWATSRWLTDVEGRRDIELTFRQMSLATPNADAPLGDEHRHHMDISRRGGRMLAAAGENAFGPMYHALGRRIHTDGSPLDAVLTMARLRWFAQLHRHRSGRPVFTTEEA